MPSSTSIIRLKKPEPDTLPPQRHDEEWAGGQMPNPEADDNTHSLAASMNLYDEDEPEELDLAGKINQAERDRHFSD